MKIRITTNMRIEWVDIAKFICIFMVMVHHLSFVPEFFRDFYRPFYLTAFFFLSGYVYKDNLIFKEHIRKKFIGLIIPWFWYGMFIIITSQLITFNKHSSFKEEIIKNFVQIRGLGDQMWFVACLFVTFIPFFFVIRKVSPQMGLLLTAGCSVLSRIYVEFMPETLFPWESNALPWHIHLSFYYIFYMTLGYYYKKYIEEKVRKYIHIKYFMIIFVFYCILIMISKIMEIYDIFILDLVFHYANCLVGIVLVLVLSNLIHTNRYISFVGKNTLTYFGLHGKVESVLETLLSYVGVMTILNESGLIAFWGGIILVFIVSLLLIIPTLIINKYFPFVVGKKYLKCK